MSDIAINMLERCQCSRMVQGYIYGTNLPCHAELRGSARDHQNFCVASRITFTNGFALPSGQPHYTALLTAVVGVLDVGVIGLH